MEPSCNKEFGQNIVHTNAPNSSSSEITFDAISTTRIKRQIHAKHAQFPCDFKDSLQKKTRTDLA